MTNFESRVEVLPWLISYNKAKFFRYLGWTDLVSFKSRSLQTINNFDCDLSINVSNSKKQLVTFNALKRNNRPPTFKRGQNNFLIRFANHEI